jgi:hypothetical protein
MVTTYIHLLTDISIYSLFDRTKDFKTNIKQFMNLHKNGWMDVALFVIFHKSFDKFVSDQNIQKIAFYLLMVI